MPVNSPAVDKPIPRLGGGLPLVGHAVEFRRDPVGLVQRGRNRHGNIFSFTLFGNTVHALTGAAGNETFFKTSDAVLSAKEAYQFTVPIFGKGVAYDTTPELMDQQLRMIHPRAARREDAKLRAVHRTGSRRAPRWLG